MKNEEFHAGEAILHSSFLRLLPENLIAYRGNKNRHKRGQDIEKTIRKVVQRRHLQDRGLCHAARVPRDEYRSDRSRIFHRTAQQTVFVSFPLIQFLIQAAGQQNGDVLVARNDITHYSGPNRSPDQRNRPMSQARE